MAAHIFLVLTFLFLSLHADAKAPAAKPIFEAAARLQLGDPQGACSTLDRNYRDSDDPDVLLLRGRCLSAQNKDAMAIKAYRRLLRRQPDLSAARTELGEIYTRNGRLAEARVLFRDSLRLKSPSTLAARLDDAIRLADRRKNWYLRTEGGITYDTNISSGPQDDQITINGRSYVFTRDGRGSLGTSFSATGGYNRELSARTGLLLQGVTTHTYYRRSSDFDLDYYNIGLGPTFAYRKMRGVALLGTSLQTLGGDPYRTVTGITARTNVKTRIPNLDALLSGTFQKIDYPNFSPRSSLFRTLTPEINYTLDPKTFFSFSTTAQWEDAKDARFDNFAYDGRIAFTRALSGNLKFNALYQYQIADYTGRQTQFGDMPRRDTRRQTVGRLDYDLSELGVSALFLSLRYQFLATASSIPLFSYARHIGTLSLVKSW